jgi:hypothetical protein
VPENEGPIPAAGTWLRGDYVAPDEAATGPIPTITDGVTIDGVISGGVSSGGITDEQPGDPGAATTVFAVVTGARPSPRRQRPWALLIALVGVAIIVILGVVAAAALSGEHGKAPSPAPVPSPPRPASVG